MSSHPATLPHIGTPQAICSYKVNINHGIVKILYIRNSDSFLRLGCTVLKGEYHRSLIVA